MASSGVEEPPTVQARTILRLHNILQVVLNFPDSDDLDAASDALARCGIVALTPPAAVTANCAQTLAISAAGAVWEGQAAVWHLQLPTTEDGPALLSPPSTMVCVSPSVVSHPTPLCGAQDCVQALLWAGSTGPPGSASILDPSTLAFGPHAISAEDQVFLATPLSFATVNRRPVVRGHVLVVPRRPAVRLAQLTSAEACDLWATVHRVQDALETHLGTSGATIVVQDGRDAGQTVPHVHVHILPRGEGDLAAASGGVVEDGDEVYDMLKGSKQGAAPVHVPEPEKWGGQVEVPEGEGTALDRDGGDAVLVTVDTVSTDAATAAAVAAGTPHHRKKRVWVVKVRTPAAMAAEAGEFRALFG